VTFLLSGLWHGASWTFVAWGALHGLYFVLGIGLASAWRFIAPALPSVPSSRLARPLRQLVTFHLVVLAWVFFRAGTLRDAWHILGNLDKGWVLSMHYSLGIGPWGVGIALLAIVVLEVVQLVHARVGGLGRWLDARPTWQRWAVYYALVFAILMFGRFDTTEFIYFQF